MGWSVPVRGEKKETLRETVGKNTNEDDLWTITLSQMPFTSNYTFCLLLMEWSPRTYDLWVDLDLISK